MWEWAWEGRHGAVQSARAEPPSVLVLVFLLVFFNLIVLRGCKSFLEEARKRHSESGRSGRGVRFDTLVGEDGAEHPEAPNYSPAFPATVCIRLWARTSSVSLLVNVLQGPLWSCHASGRRAAHVREGQRAWASGR